MLWLSPPPYLRRLVAAALVVGALVIDLAGRATVDHPFVTADLVAGDVVDEAVVEYREVPAGLLPPVGEPLGFAARPLSPGDPLVPSALAEAAPPPPGWWSIRTPLPPDVAVGDRVRLVSPDPPVDVEGVVSSPPVEPMLGGGGEGMVAVPPDTAGAAAVAVARGTVTVLVGT